MLNIKWSLGFRAHEMEHKTETRGLQGCARLRQGCGPPPINSDCEI